MKYAILLYCIMLTISGYCVAQELEKGIKSLEISGDTVLYNDEPYCLLKRGIDGYYITTLNVRQIAYLRPVVRNKTDYYEVSITPLRRTYYTAAKEGIILSFLHDMIKYEVIWEGDFSAYGANMLKDEKLKAGAYYEEWDVPAREPKPRVLDWNISWKSTERNDCTLIYANGRLFAYYKYANWRDSGVNRYMIAIRKHYSYSYFVHDIATDSLLAEVRVKDGWQTEVKVLTADEQEYTIKNVPENRDFMTIAAKLLLAREAFGDKK